MSFRMFENLRTSKDMSDSTKTLLEDNKDEKVFAEFMDKMTNWNKKPQEKCGSRYCDKLSISQANNTSAQVHKNRRPFPTEIIKKGKKAKPARYHTTDPQPNRKAKKHHKNSRKTFSGKKGKSPTATDSRSRESRIKSERKRRNKEKSERTKKDTFGSEKIIKEKVTVNRCFKKVTREHAKINCLQCGMTHYHSTIKVENLQQSTTKVTKTKMVG